MYDNGSDWLTVEDCARRMAVSEDRVRELMRSRALRSRYEYGGLLVQPAIVTGAVP